MAQKMTPTWKLLRSSFGLAGEVAEDAGTTLGSAGRGACSAAFGDTTNASVRSTTTADEGTMSEDAATSEGTTGNIAFTEAAEEPLGNSTRDSARSPTAIMDR